MANKKPDGSQSGCDEDAFGWHLYHDRQHHLVYYLHSFTGEVRWPRPETVGFVMHGLRPLPAQADDAPNDTNLVNPDIWSPYYPHVVMLPSGLVQVHPSPGSEIELRCGYNRFPLRGSSVPPDYETPSVRRLPPTWESSRNGLPFLPPHPVAVLGPDATEKNHQVASTSRVQQMLAMDRPRNYLSLQTGNFGRVQGSLDWSTLQTSSSTFTLDTNRKLPVYSRGLITPTNEKKEHNRKGYLLRQARKQMRDCSSSSSNSSAIGSTRQRKGPRRPTTTLPKQPTTTIPSQQDNVIGLNYGAHP